MQSVPKYNGETGEPILYVEFQTPLGRALSRMTPEAKEELQSIIEQKLGKSIEASYAGLQEDASADERFRRLRWIRQYVSNIHMDVVIEED